MSRQDRQTTERHTKTLRELVKQPANKFCADCKRNDARWASWNIGVFLCIRCSGIHRSMGTHISKVKSVDLDTWTPEQMASILSWGNTRANIYWEAHLKAGHIPPEHKMESFIRSKYESKRWAMEGPPPSDPSTLESAPSSSAPTTTASPPASSSPPTQQRQTAPAAPPVTTRATAPRHQLLSAQHTQVQPQQRVVSPPLASTPAASVVPVAQAQAPPADDLFSLDFHGSPATNTGSGGVAGGAGGPKKDVKDIMSLFAASANAPAAAVGWGGPAVQQQFAQPQQFAQQAQFAQKPQAQFTQHQQHQFAPPFAQQPQPQPQQQWSQGQHTWAQPPPTTTSSPPPAHNSWGTPVTAQSQAFAGLTAIGGSGSGLSGLSAFGVAGGSGGGFGGASATPIADIWGTTGGVGGGGGGVGGGVQKKKEDDVFGDIWGGFK